MSIMINEVFCLQFESDYFNIMTDVLNGMTDIGATAKFKSQMDKIVEISLGSILDNSISPCT